MAAKWQNPPDAGVILRASGGKELHAHKVVLSLASSVFRDLLSVPQPPVESSQTPIIDVDDPPEALEAFLQIIYPIPNPPANNTETLASLLRLADKYDAKVVFDTFKTCSPLTCVDPPPPIHIYVILCACGLEKDAEAVARRVPFASLICLDSRHLHLMTTVQYHRLVSFMIARHQRMQQIVNQHREHIVRDAFCCFETTRQLYSSIIVGTVQAAFEADPCVRVVEALGLVSRAPVQFSLCGVKCRFGVAGLQKYAEGLLKELVEMAESLPWVD